MKNKSIVLDTNLWISFLITKQYQELFKNIQTGKIVLLISPELLKELTSVAQRPKFKSYFSSLEVEILLNAIIKYAKMILTESNVNLCRDPKDNFLLNLSIDGKADYLISGDKDLLTLQKVENTEIITIREFTNKSKYKQ